MSNYNRTDRYYSGSSSGNRRDSGRDSGRRDDRRDNSRRDDYRRDDRRDTRRQEVYNYAEPVVEEEEDGEREVFEEAYSFEDMKLKDNLLRGIYAFGFEKPSLIQSKSIPTILTLRDTVAQAQSGTGKTGTFVISMLNIIDDSEGGCQGLILAPTRELALQITDVCSSLGQYINIKVVLCVGGSDIHTTRDELDSDKCVILVGTPGRVIDLVRRDYVNLKTLKLLVVDEADEMLSNNFADQIRSIVYDIGKKTQVCLFSATMPVPVLEMTKHFMTNPAKILVKTGQLTLEGIKQYYVDAEQDSMKFDFFCHLYEHISVSQAIVYVNQKRLADDLKYKLEDNNFTVSVIHSGLRPYEREDIMKDFRSGKTRILISTDLLSRGIDIQQISIVINYELPNMNNKESYIHRIGRSGRFGRKGIAINIVTDRDFYKIKELERFYQTEIAPLPKDINNILV